MSGLTGSIASLAKLQSDLRRIASQGTAIKVASASASQLTALVKETFDAGENPYGLNWAPGADGQKVTLRKSGALANGLVYVATGTKLRIRLAVKYAKYQVGKRRVAPSQGEPLPIAYVRALSRTAVAVCRAEMGR
jgi:hypothetical protein